MIPFNLACFLGKELEYVKEAINSGKISGDGEFTKKCHRYLEHELMCEKVLLTTSCTHALEISSLLLDIKEGDEIILPSYTFVSTANPFVLRGAKLIFVDIEKNTMNIDPLCVEKAITKRTKAIVPVHYAGIGCQMEKLLALTDNNRIAIIEDAAQAYKAEYNSRLLGTIGNFSAISFHDTKNITCGEGGALIVNDSRYAERAEIIREKGTNRANYLRGQVDKYTWVDIGSSYLPSELNAAYLLAQLESATEIIANRVKTWEFYSQSFQSSVLKERIEVMQIPENCVQNGHMFWIKLRDIEDRSRLIQYLKSYDIIAAFHYIPLHSTDFGRQNGIFCGDDINTTAESERLVRLPLYYGMNQSDLEKVVTVIEQYCQQ